MGVRILSDGEDACMYCSTTEVAFGPIFHEEENHSGEERAEAFQRWLPLDARKYTDAELRAKYSEWLDQEKIQWKTEEREDAEDSDVG